VLKRIISAVKRAEFVSDRISYIIVRGRWCHITVLKDHAPTEVKTDDVKDSFYEELELVFHTLPKYSMKFLLGDFNAQVGRQDRSKPTIGNGSLYEISNDNGVRLLNFATSKSLTVKSTMFKHRYIHKYTLTSPDGKTHNQIGHILVDTRRNSNTSIQWYLGLRVTWSASVLQDKQKFLINFNFLYERCHAIPVLCLLSVT
jgi:hypothetical protein